MKEKPYAIVQEEVRLEFEGEEAAEALMAEADSRSRKIRRLPMILVAAVEEKYFVVGMGFVAGK